MKKLLISGLILIIVGLSAWILFGRSTKEVPLPETISGSPFGSNEGINIPATGDESVGEMPPLNQDSTESKMFRVSNVPTAGFVLMPRGTDTWVRYLDRGTGHIYDALLPKEGAGGELITRKITNNTIPKVYEAIFRNDGNAVVLRTLEGESDVIKNLSLALSTPKASSTSELYSVVATNLRGNTGEMAAGAGNSLVYVLSDNTSIASSLFDGSNVKTLLNSTFTDWKLGKLGGNILVYSKASYIAPGYAYSLSAGGGGSLTRVVGPNSGLTAIANSNGTRLLYSYVESGMTKLAVKNLQNGSISEIIPASLSEKCTWSTKNINTFYCGTPLNGVGQAEPDNWYLGRSHYTDYVWEFDTDSEIAQLVAEPKTDFGIDIDVYQPVISPNEDFLIFLNKRDLTLWAIRLE